MKIAFVLISSLIGFSAFGSPDIRGTWRAPGMVTYNSALTPYATDYFEIKSQDFVWMRQLGRHHETEEYTYTIENENELVLTNSRGDVLVAKIESDENQLRICMTWHCFELEAIENLPRLESGSHSVPGHGISWTWSMGEKSESYDFAISPYPSSFTPVFPGGFALHFRGPDDQRYMAVFMAALVGEDVLDPTSYKATLNLYRVEGQRGVPLVEQEEAQSITPGTPIVVEFGEPDKTLKLELTIQ